jgi:hypothetical protein
MRFGLVVLSLLMVSILLPGANALFLSEKPFQTSVRAKSLTGSGNGSEPSLQDLAFFTGSSNWEGEDRGVFGFVDTMTLSVTSIERVEVFNVTALSSAVAKHKRPSGSALQEFTDASITLKQHSSVLLLADDARINYACKSPFGIALPILMPNDIFDSAAAAVEGPHLLTSGRDGECSMKQAVRTDLTDATLLNNQSVAIVSGMRNGAQETAEFKGTDWAFRLHGEPNYAAQAEGVITPFKSSAKATYAPYGGGDLEQRFGLDALQTLVDAMGGGKSENASASQDSGFDQLIETVRSIAPVLNGVFVGNMTSAAVVESKVFKAQGWAFVRFKSMGVLQSSSGGDDLALSANARLILVDRDLYATQSKVDMGPLSIPTLSIILWILAIGAIVASIFMRPFVGAEQIKTYGFMPLLALVFHLLALVAAFILWDFEVKAFLGTSLITLFLGGATGEAAALGLVGLFQVLPFGLAMLFFGYPLRFITNAALKLGGLRKAKGIGKGVGNLAAWGIGAAFLPVLLGGFLAMALGLLSGFSP